MEPNPEIVDHLEDDDAHLNERGYELFAEALWEAYGRMREKYEKGGGEWRGIE